MNKSQLKSKVPTISKGYTIGQLTVKERLSEKKNGYSYWRCECDCGGEILLDTLWQTGMYGANGRTQL